MTYPEKLISDAVDIYGAPFVNRSSELAFYNALALIMGVALFISTESAFVAAGTTVAIGGAATLYLVFSKRITPLSVERYLKSNLLEFSGMGYAPIPPEPVFFRTLRQFAMLDDERAPLSDGVVAETIRGDFQIYRRASTEKKPVGGLIERIRKPSGYGRLAQICCRVEIELRSLGHFIVSNDEAMASATTEAARYFEEGLMLRRARVEGRDLYCGFSATYAQLSETQIQLTRRLLKLNSIYEGAAFLALARKSPKGSSDYTELLFLIWVPEEEAVISSMDKLQAFARETVEHQRRVLGEMLEIINIGDSLGQDVT